MTKHEKMIVSAYTGILMVDFREFHEWVEEFLGHPVWSHEFTLSDFWDSLKAKVEDEFVKICECCDE